MSLPSLDEPTLRSVVSPAAAVAAIREAFRADGEGRTAVPAVINLPIPGTRGEFHVKTAWVDSVPFIAVKVASGSITQSTYVAFRFMHPTVQAPPTTLPGS